MRNLNLAVSFTCLCFILTSCNQPKLVNKNNYYKGQVEIPQTTDENYGLLYVNAKKEATTPINQPIRGIIYKGGSDYLLKDDMNFQIYNSNGILYAKPISNIENLELDTAYNSIKTLGLIDLHIEGPDNTDGGMHSKVHILNPTGNTYNDGLNDYTEIETENTATQSNSRIIIVYTNEYLPIRDSLLIEPDSDLYTSFERTITINSVDHTFARISFEHTHHHGPQH